MPKEIHCELLNRTRELAKKKGLDAREVICAEDNVCDGSFCALMIDTIPTEVGRPSPVDVFNARLSKREPKVFRVEHGVLFEMPEVKFMMRQNRLGKPPVESQKA